MADAEDSKSSVRKHMRVQVPPSAPKFFPTVLRFLARLTLAELCLLSKAASQPFRAGGALCYPMDLLTKNHCDECKDPRIEINVATSTAREAACLLKTLWISLIVTPWLVSAQNLNSSIGTARTFSHSALKS
jgi:hypothetical protein